MKYLTIIEKGNTIDVSFLIDEYIKKTAQELHYFSKRNNDLKRREQLHLSCDGTNH